LTATPSYGGKESDIRRNKNSKCEFLVEREGNTNFLCLIKVHKNYMPSLYVRAGRKFTIMEMLGQEKHTYLSK
jgi:hypothetical protein